MKLFAPIYYRDFSCIADRCRHSCCVGWEISIDEITKEKYSSLQDGYGIAVKESIDYTEEPRFRLGASERCPHLDDRGLCRIISELGEEYLCDICRLHPRFFNITPKGAEVGVGMACEAAAELILSSDEYSDIVEVGEYTEEFREGADFDILPVRNRIFSILKEENVPYDAKLKKIYSEFSVSPSDVSDGEWRELLSSLEYLEEGSRVKFFGYSSALNTPEECESMLERSLAYFVFRHLASSRDGGEMKRTLGACLFLERLLASLAVRDGVSKPSDFAELARVVSSELEYSEDNMEEIKMMFL